jgi:hypothetical protein
MTASIVRSPGEPDKRQSDPASACLATEELVHEMAKMVRSTPSTP